MTAVLTSNHLGRVSRWKIAESRCAREKIEGLVNNA